MAALTLLPLLLIWCFDPSPRAVASWFGQRARQSASRFSLVDTVQNLKGKVQGHTAGLVSGLVPPRLRMQVARATGQAPEPVVFQTAAWDNLGRKTSELADSLTHDLKNRAARFTSTLVPPRVRTYAGRALAAPAPRESYAVSARRHPAPSTSVAESAPERPAARLASGNPAPTRAGASADFGFRAGIVPASRSGVANQRPFEDQNAQDPRLRPDPLIQFLANVWWETRSFLDAHADLLPGLLDEGGPSWLTAAYRPSESDRDGGRRSRPGRSDRGQRPSSQLQPTGSSSYGDSSSSEPSVQQRSLARSFQPWDVDLMDGALSPAGQVIAKVPGLRLENVTLFQGFSSNGFPRLGGVSPFLANNLGHDIDFGGTATLAWRFTRPRTALQVIYVPSYTNRLEFPEWTSADHSLVIGLKRNVSPRWELNVTGRGALRGMEQVFLDPPVLAGVENPPAGFDELIAAAEGGDLTSDEVASLLTGAPVVVVPERAVFDLNRVLGAAAEARASYRHSPRLSVEFGAQAYHSEIVNPDERSDELLKRNLLQRTDSASAFSDVHYAISPRTDIGVELNVRHTDSDFARANYISTEATLSQKVGRRWTVALTGGVGAIRGLSENQNLLLTRDSGGRPLWVAGVDVRYLGRSQSISLKAQRKVGDTFGLGARDTDRVSAKWQWWRPGADWGIEAEGQWYELSLGGGFPSNAQGRVARVAWVRRLTPETSLTTEYSFGTFASPFRGVVSDLKRHRVQVSWTWRPSEGR